MEELLKAAGLTILRQEGKYFDLDHGYRIEVENDQLFKLLHEGSVVGPFDDPVELISFVKMDMQLNGWS